jgi:hypothetical protein
LQVLGGLTFFIRTKVLALVIGPAGISVVSVIDQFVQLVMQLSALAIPCAAAPLRGRHGDNNAGEQGTK